MQEDRFEKDLYEKDVDVNAHRYEEKDKYGYARMEELLPLVSGLAEKYTSGESTSVTYETAQMLMGAVLYCIGEYMDGSSRVSINGENQTAVLKEIYRRGYETVLARVQEAKCLYEALAADFEDYGCRNYFDTIIKGMPSFFLRYDPVFQPQNSVLMLDYPLLFGNPDAKGADRILMYLKGITVEAKFLSRFRREDICALLECIQPDYQNLYFDNICDPVLMQVIGCLVTDRPAGRLVLTEDDAREAAVYFHGSTKEKIGQQIRFFLRLLFQQEKITGQGIESWSYFQPAADMFASRIESADRLGFLETLFLVKKK